MGRPTDEPKNRLVGIRLDKELEDFFVTGKDNISESVRMALKEYVKQKNNEKRGFVEQNIDFVEQKPHNSVKHYGSLPEELYNDLMSMLKVSGMTYEQFMACIDALMYDGMIMVENGKVVTSDSRLDTSGLITKCDEYGIKDYQGVFDKMVKTMKVN